VRPSGSGLSSGSFRFRPFGNPPESFRGRRTPRWLVPVGLAVFRSKSWLRSICRRMPKANNPARSNKNWTPRMNADLSNACGTNVEVTNVSGQSQTGAQCTNAHCQSRTGTRRQRASPVCYKSGKRGHVARECYPLRDVSGTRIRTRRQGVSGPCHSMDGKQNNESTNRSTTNVRVRMQE
jgi:hypothetical protein